MEPPLVVLSEQSIQEAGRGLMAKLFLCRFFVYQLPPSLSYVLFICKEKLRAFSQLLAQSRIILRGTKEIKRCFPFSSSLVHQWKYDVFVSFSGEDVRKAIASHLFHGLKQVGFWCFEDNGKVEARIFIEPKVLDAIHHSRVSLVVFTANYVGSWWCLDELEEILQCNMLRDHHVGHRSGILGST